MYLVTSTLTLIKQIVDFLIDAIYKVVVGQVFRQSAEILMDTNCVSLLADLFLYSYEAEFIQKFLHEKKSTGCDLQYTIFPYIEDALTVSNKNSIDISQWT
jgi:hypothetical protein